MKKTLLIVIGIPALAVACAQRVPLGDGTLTGKIPSGWEDSERLSGETVLVLQDDWEPLPRQIVVRRLPPDVSAPPDWELVEELDVPAPSTRVGDVWQENTRQVRRYRRAFPDGRAFEADVDARLAGKFGLRFLGGLRPGGR